MKSDIKNQLKILIPVLLGIIFIFISIIADPAFKTTVINAENADTNVTGKISATDFKSAFYKDFTLEKGERIYVKFSIKTENMTAKLIILTKAAFLTAKSQNTTAGDTIANLRNFVVFAPEVGDNFPSGTDTNKVSLSYGDTVQLEFAGDTDGGDTCISVPGEYVIMVYGTNLWANDSNPNIPFNLYVSTEGPWKTVETTFAILAFVALAIAGVIALYLYRPSLFGGVEE